MSVTDAPVAVAHRPRSQGAGWSLNEILAFGAVAAITLAFPLKDAITSATVVSVALAPVWWRATKQFVGARVLIGLGALALASGLWLSALATSDHAVNPLVVRSTTFLMIGGFCSIGLILWARTVLSLRVVGLAAAAGIIARLAVVEPPNPVNPWKHGISYALIVLLLALVLRNRPRPVEIVLLLGLAVASALNDSRSAFATLLLTALLVAWQLRPTTMGRKTSALATIALFAGVAACVYSVGTTLILDGYLGESTQQRSQAQVEASGSILLGGRPEWGASIALSQDRPIGFGVGVIANLDDILVAKSGMADLNYDPNNGYVENYMFGSEIKLHALVADLWANFGIPGLVLAGAMLGITIWSLATLVARRTAPALVIYLTCLFLWNFAFGPILSSMPGLVLGLGLLLVRRDHEPTERPTTVTTT